MKKTNRRPNPKSSINASAEISALWGAITELNDDLQWYEERLIDLETVNPARAQNERQYLKQEVDDRGAALVQLDSVSRLPT
jgi:hypothetical protein